MKNPFQRALAAHPPLRWQRQVCRCFLWSLLLCLWCSSLTPAAQAAKKPKAKPTPTPTPIVLSADPIVLLPQTVPIVPGPTSTPLPAPTPYSNGGYGRIVFSSDRDGNDEIYSMKMDGSDALRLTNDAASDLWPSLSRDGSKIVFVSNRDPVFGDYDVYVMNADGSNVTSVDLGDNRWDDLCPVFSPDGSKIAFESSPFTSWPYGGANGNGRPHIFVVNTNGSNLKRLTLYDGHEPCFTPDGLQIAWQASGLIYRVNVDGTGPTWQITPNGQAASNPAFSSEGGSLLYQVDGDLYLKDNSSVSTTTQLTSGLEVEQNPVFSADGTRIVFNSWKDGTSEIYSMKLDATDRVQLTSNAAVDQQVSCSVLGNRADAMIRNADEAGVPTMSKPFFVGDNLYNTTGAGQSRRQAVRTGAPAIYHVRLENDWYTTSPLKVTGTGDDPGWTVRYFDDLKDGNDVTAQVVSGGWSTRALTPGDFQEMRIEVTATASANYANEQVVLLRAAAPDDSGPDVVRAVTVRRWDVDALIRSANEAAYRGDNIYSADGTRQTAAQALVQASDGPLIYFVRVQNDGNATQALRLSGPSSGTGWTAHYFSAPRGGSDITGDMSSAGWNTPMLAAGGFHVVRLELLPDNALTLGQEAAVPVRVDTASGEASDVVKALAGLQRLDRLQYSLDFGANWTDAPTSAGAFITAHSKATLGLRAVKTYPNLPWPSQPDWSPVWNAGAVRNVGEENWLLFEDVSQNDADLRTATAQCGNAVSVQIKVAP